MPEAPQQQEPQQGGQQTPYPELPVQERQALREELSREETGPGQLPRVLLEQYQDPRFKTVEQAIGMNPSANASISQAGNALAEALADPKNQRGAMQVGGELGAWWASGQAAEYVRHLVQSSAPVGNKFSKIMRVARMLKLDTVVKTAFGGRAVQAVGRTAGRSGAAGLGAAAADRVASLTVDPMSGPDAQDSAYTAFWTSSLTQAALDPVAGVANRLRMPWGGLRPGAAALRQYVLDRGMGLDPGYAVDATWLRLAHSIMEHSYFGKGPNRAGVARLTGDVTDELKAMGSGVVEQHVLGGNAGRTSDIQLSQLISAAHESWDEVYGLLVADRARYLDHIASKKVADFASRSYNAARVNMTPVLEKAMELRRRGLASGGFTLGKNGQLVGNGPGQAPLAKELNVLLGGKNYRTWEEASLLHSRWSKLSRTSVQKDPGATPANVSGVKQLNGVLVDAQEAKAKELGQDFLNAWYDYRQLATTQGDLARTSIVQAAMKEGKQETVYHAMKSAPVAELKLFKQAFKGIEAEWDFVRGRYIHDLLAKASDSSSGAIGKISSSKLKQALASESEERIAAFLAPLRGGSGAGRASTAQEMVNRMHVLAEVLEGAEQEIGTNALSLVMQFGQAGAVLGIATGRAVGTGISVLVGPKLLAELMNKPWVFRVVTDGLSYSAETVVKGRTVGAAAAALLREWAGREDETRHATQQMSNMASEINAARAQLEALPPDQFLAPLTDAEKVDPEVRGKYLDEVFGTGAPRR